MRRLNIGSGQRPLPGYINLDIDEVSFVDVVADCRCLPFKENTFDEIHSRAVLEHISWRETFDVLWEWRRVLKFGGTLIVSVPNWQWLRQQEKTAWEIVPWVMGAQRDQYDYHKALFDVPTLKMYFVRLGLNEVEIEDRGFYITARGKK